MHRDRSAMFLALAGALAGPLALTTAATADFLGPRVELVGDFGVGAPTYRVYLDFDDPSDVVVAISGDDAPLAYQSLDGAAMYNDFATGSDFGPNGVPADSWLALGTNPADIILSPGWTIDIDGPNFSTTAGYFDGNPATPVDGGSILVGQFTADAFLFQGTVAFQTSGGGLEFAPFMISVGDGPCPGCGDVDQINTALTGSIVGGPSGEPWAWQLRSPDGSFPPIGPVIVPGITPGNVLDDENGDGVWDEADIAIRFRDSINFKVATAGCAPGSVQAQALVFGGISILSVSASCDFDLLVSEPSNPTYPSCVIDLGGCTFNPNMASLPLPGLDCNQNGFDDSIDIELGTSADANGNGVPDECEAPPCPADLDGDGSVGLGDLLTVLASWGPNQGSPADFDGDGTVGLTDLLTVLASWGAC